MMEIFLFHSRKPRCFLNPAHEFVVHFKRRSEHHMMRPAIWIRLGSGSDTRRLHLVLQTKGDDEIRIWQLFFLAHAQNDTQQN